MLSASPFKWFLASFFSLILIPGPRRLRGPGIPRLFVVIKNAMIISFLGESTLVSPPLSKDCRIFRLSRVLRAGTRFFFPHTIMAGEAH